MTPAYAELACATNFSFLRGASHPEELAVTAARLGLAGLAVTDRNSLAGVVRAHMAAKEAGLRFAVGCRLVFNDGTPDILAWPRDRTAYGRLVRLLTVGNRRAPKGDCYLQLDDLLEWGTGLILAPVPGLHLDSQLTDTLTTLAEAFPDQIRLAAARAFSAHDQRRLARLSVLAEACHVPLLAIGDVYYHAPERRQLQDILTCIREHVSLDEAGRLLAANAERHLKNPAETARLFRSYRQAVAESVAVLGALDFCLDELRYEYPEEPSGPSATPQDELGRLTYVGAKRRYPGGLPEKVDKTLRHELGLIEQLGYAPYFLTVYDIVRFARSQDILAQGRGSAANSAVCFCLGITEVDPDRADLLFERFISPERNEPPDIDVDFEHERREEVLQYVYDKYGRDRAGLAATVITYRSRSAVREVGKAFGLSEDAVGALAGTIWGMSSGGVDEKDARRAGLDPDDDRMNQVLEFSRQIIGFPRHLSQHVGGFVITRGRLDEVVPIQNAAMEDRTVIEWDKDDLESLGMLKIDLLGLGMLSCIRKALTLLEDHYDRRLSIAEIPAEDPAIYDMLCRADSLGTFQVESRAQMTMLPRLWPRAFYDLVIEVAIVRPGPIQGDMVHPYLRRRQGKEKVTYPKKELERVLSKTMGVPLFQEQAMQIAIVAADFTPAEADRLRRAMATFRRVGTIGSFQQKLIDGMVKNGYEAEFAARCFRQIEGFGEYGFPESHAASFALLVYASAWLKCHYPDVFLAAILNAQPMGFYAPAQLVRDAREHGVEVREVDINLSNWDARLEVWGEEEKKYEGGSVVVEEAQDNVGPVSQPSQASGTPPPVASRRPPPWRGRLGSGQQTQSILRKEHAPSHSLPPGGGGPGRGGPAEVQLHHKSSSNPDPAPSYAIQNLHAMHGEMADQIWSTRAVRLGFRQIKGLSEAHVEVIVDRRGAGYDSLRDLWLRTGLPRSVIERLAEADAFRSIGLDRRAALWAARGLDAGKTADRLPLFDVAGLGDIRREPDVALPPMPLGEHVINDYRTLRLSLKAHPVSFVRTDLNARKMLVNEALRSLPQNRQVNISGLVLVRQRPGSAKGVIFMTLEDETAVANVIVWPDVFERYRPVVLGSRFIAVTGRLQNEQGVIHVVAQHLENMTPLLETISDKAATIDPFARCDEVKRPIADQRAKVSPGGRLIRLLADVPDLQTDYAQLADKASQVLPKGRNFH